MRNVTIKITFEFKISISHPGDDLTAEIQVRRKKVKVETLPDPSSLAFH